MITIISELIADYLIDLLTWYVLFPVVWLVSLPFILVLALFRRGRYGDAVIDMLSSVHYFWQTFGII